MSTISASSRLIETRALGTGTTSVYDVTDRIKSWGRRGVFLGANFGLVFGAIFVAIPFTSDVLTFGTLGTLVVGTVECAVIAGAFAAMAAALYGKSVGDRSTARFEHILQVQRPSSVSLPLHQISDGDQSPAFSLHDAQARLSTIDAWENGNTGP